MPTNDASHQPKPRLLWRWPWPVGPRGAACALAIAVGVGALLGALAGPPARGSAAAPRGILAAASPPQADGPLPAADLGALQGSPVAAPPTAAPAPPPPPASSGAATDGPDDEPSASDGTGDSAGEASAPASDQTEDDAPPRQDTAAADPPAVKHVVVVALADKGFDEAFGRASAAPYLARDLRAKGALLRRYFATSHGSLPNLVALLSGQGANAGTATGCPALTPFVPKGKPASDGQVRGRGCVFDAAVATLTSQLEAKKRPWHAYVAGAADPVAGALPGPCPAPPAAPDGSRPTADRNPFLFLAGISAAANCTAKVTGFATLATDLTAAAEQAPAFTLVVPDACSAGRDGACPVGEPAGLARSDAWLREWIPRLQAAPAYADDGMIVVTFDQARVAGAQSDSTSCCHQPLGVNEPESVDPQAPAPGGGRVGALVLSPRVKPGVVTDVPYNHFALLRTIEDIFELDHLGLAGDDELEPFGADVFGKRR
jgi:hypothetical protein